MFEQYLFYLLSGGFIMLLLGYLWLIIAAFQLHRRWGIATMLFPPTLIPLLYKHRQAVLGPTMLIIAGTLLISGAYGVNYYTTHHLDLGEREKMVELERHLTLTGWDKADYSFLRNKTDTVVLQMANADVTDDTLDFLADMKQLRELDVSYSQVSDAGLARLKTLPALAKLFVRKTALTDEGFREQLLNQETLLELDARNTGIKSATLREWKEKQPELRKFLK
jgi:hypothetical protein